MGFLSIRESCTKFTHKRDTNGSSNNGISREDGGGGGSDAIRPHMSVRARVTLHFYNYYLLINTLRSSMFASRSGSLQPTTVTRSARLHAAPTDPFTMFTMFRVISIPYRLLALLPPRLWILSSIVCDATYFCYTRLLCHDSVCAFDDGLLTDNDHEKTSAKKKKRKHTIRIHRIILYRRFL